MTDVLIRNKAGEEYVVTVADFRRVKAYPNEDGELVTYEDAGFKIVWQHPSGEPYEPPRRAAEPKAESARADEPAKAEDKKS